MLRIPVSISWWQWFKKNNWQQHNTSETVVHSVPDSIVSCLQVIVTQSTEGFAEPQEIKTLGVGDYFGEKALIRYKQRFHWRHTRWIWNPLFTCKFTCHLMGTIVISFICFLHFESAILMLSLFLTVDASKFYLPALIFFCGRTDNPQVFLTNAC